MTSTMMVIFVVGLVILFLPEVVVVVSAATLAIGYWVLLLMSPLIIIYGEQPWRSLAAFALTLAIVAASLPRQYRKRHDGAVASRAASALEAPFLILHLICEGVKFVFSDEKE